MTIGDMQIQMTLLNGTRKRAIIHVAVGSKIYGNMGFYQGGDGQLHVDFPPQYCIAKDLKKQIRQEAITEYERLEEHF